MPKSLSKIADNRRAGKHQIEELRTRILDAAESLFLQQGIENTSMAEIAARLGISRVTMYRYFANRDAIAVEIQVRMLQRINAVPPINEHPPTLESYRDGIRAIVRQYTALRDAYRYIGMFDAIYLDQSADDVRAQWIRVQLRNSILEESMTQGYPPPQIYGSRLGIILDTFTWVLEKLALRGDFTLSDPSIPLEQNMAFFEKIILSALDLLEEESGDTQDH